MKRTSICLFISIFGVIQTEQVRGNDSFQIPIPTSKPYVWAEWLTEKENIWLRDRVKVIGAHVSVDIGEQAEHYEWHSVPAAFISLFKRYKQATQLTVHWNERQDFYWAPTWLPHQRKMLGLPLILRNGRNSYFGAPLSRYQMNEIASGRLTFLQVHEKHNKTLLPDDL